MIPIVGDLEYEVTESFLVTLSAPSKASLGKSEGACTILDNDPVPILISIDDASASEKSTLTFTVTLSAPSAQTVTVDYATADGSAVAGVDYTSAAGTLSFPPGVVSLTVTVPALRDKVAESDETFFVNLSGAVNATISRPQGVGSVKDMPKRRRHGGSCGAVELESLFSLVLCGVLRRRPFWDRRSFR